MAVFAVYEEPDILAAKSGDQEAFTRLVRRYESSLTQYLGRFATNAAAIEDLRQETYIEAYLSLSAFEGRGSFRGWLWRIASRVGYRYWARRSREARGRVAFVEMLRACPSCETRQRRQENLQDLTMLLARLGREDRALLEMRYVRGLRATQIAGLLGWEPVRVRVRLHRLLKRLQGLCGRASIRG
jgi:RNA polymerase sigma-70 factor (ECF subfamily)